MRTVLYLLRHGATAANLARPPRLQGRRQDLPLAPVGVRQAELTRDLLAVRGFDGCFSSPLRRARETASIVAAPCGLDPIVIDDLTECDVGAWENLDWESIRAGDAERYRRFMDDPAQFGYPDGESFQAVFVRASRALEKLFQDCAGERFLVVSHHVVNRTYLATLLGLTVAQARLVQLDNCGISVVERVGGRTNLLTLNASFHLQGAAA
jgi:broad specificity phosphatase PhoE